MARSDARLILAGNIQNPLTAFNEGREQKTRNKLLDLASQRQEAGIAIDQENQDFRRQDRDFAIEDREAAKEAASAQTRARDFARDSVRLKSLIDSGDMQGAMQHALQRRDELVQKGLPTTQTDQRIELLRASDGRIKSLLEADLAEARELGVIRPEELTKLGKDDSLVNSRGEEIARGIGESDTERRNRELDASLKLEDRLNKKRHESLQTEEGFRKEFNDLTKDFRKISDAFSRVQASASDPSPAGDLALIFNYMKILDPGSTVREGEFANAQNSGSLPQTIVARYNQVVSGERLASEVRDDFVERSAGLFNAALGDANTTAEEYRRIANDAGVNPDNITGLVSGRDEVSVPDKDSPFTEGQTATGPNGQKIVFKDGRWVPM